MKFSSVILSLFALVLALEPSGVVSGQGWAYPPEFEGARVETHKKTPQADLKLWIFDPPELRTGEKRPAIVFFFGGGWRGGSPAQFEHQCRDLAAVGMVAITADYRVLNRHKTLADSCVADARSAIRWVRANAERLHVDPNRIVAAGGSAGGHIAACTGILQSLDDPADDVGVSCSPNLLALFNPALILAPMEDLPADEKAAANLAERLGVPARSISPIHQLRENLPPTIIFHGEDDPTVPFATVKKFTQASTALGNQCKLVAYPKMKHGFFNYGERF